MTDQPWFFSLVAIIFFIILSTAFSLLVLRWAGDQKQEEFTSREQFALLRGWTLVNHPEDGIEYRITGPAREPPWTLEHHWNPSTSKNRGSLVWESKTTTHGQAAMLMTPAAPPLPGFLDFTSLLMEKLLTFFPEKAMAAQLRDMKPYPLSEPLKGRYSLLARGDNALGPLERSLEKPLLGWTVTGQGKTAVFLGPQGLSIHLREHDYTLERGAELIALGQQVAQAMDSKS